MKKTLCLNLTDDTLTTLALYLEHKQDLLATTNEKQQLKHREECRSYAVEFVVSLFALNPLLAQAAKSALERQADKGRDAMRQTLADHRAKGEPCKP